MQSVGHRTSWRPFLAVELATLLSGAANGITIIALPWLVLERTGSATQAAALAAITALPSTVSAVFSGAMVDRFGRRRVSIVSDLFSLTGVALIPVMDAVIGLNFALLCLLAIIGAVFDPAGIGAREAMVPEAAETAGLSLSRANGIHEANWASAYVVGPGLGGVLIATIGAAATFWATALVFLFSALVILVTPIPAGDDKSADGAGFWQTTGSGITFVWRDRLLRTTTILMLVLVAIWLPVEGIILPVFFQAESAPEQLGFIIMAMALGGIGGAIVYSVIGEKLDQYKVFVGALLATGVFVLGLSFLVSPWLMAIWGFCAGFAFGSIGPVINVTMQVRTPPAIRGRVVGLLVAVEYAAAPFGMLLVGPLIDAWGVELSFTILAVLLLMACLSTPFLKSLRDLKTLPKELPPPSSFEETQPPRPLS